LAHACAGQAHQEGRRGEQVIGSLEAIGGGVVIALLQGNLALGGQTARRGAIGGGRPVLRFSEPRAEAHQRQQS
jgi:hypothetical protein